MALNPLSWLGLGVEREAPKPFKEMGKSGVQRTGGFLVSAEKNRSLIGQEKYRTYAELSANVSIIGASIRFWSNLITSSNWSVEAVDDTPQAIEMAEFIENSMHTMEVNWNRVVEHAAMYKFVGVSVNEWTARRDADGRISYRTVESRPPATISRYDIDEQGTVLGFVQQDVNALGRDLYIPKSKVIYLTDALLTESPDGMGLLRHCAESADRLKAYELFERIGYERDLRGIPIAKAPYSELNDWAGDDKERQSIAQQYLGNIERFVQMQVRGSSTGLVLDSKTYNSQSDTGTSVSGTPQWDVGLLQGGANGFSDIDRSIGRINAEMARIFSTDGLVLGAENASSQALSRDKTENLNRQVNATLRDLADAFTKDYIRPLFELNGFDEALMPWFTTEDVGKKSPEEIAAALADLARAGLSPDDEAIDHLRVAMGLPRQPEGGDVLDV